ncbi:hypothetical protein QAD02_004024 [Eretmocerus hayati]|uniref:Uncharacterized protein n=1 Tax=Eretmocerus hayati TaxID=131215 RepID=A0ACC2NNV5_9HYME|nr:hypothetical protein QAD02_004024 [Eretmocerus hayati]
MADATCNQTCDEKDAQNDENTKKTPECIEEPAEEVVKCKKARLKKCVGFADYKCEEEAPWRTYMKLYADQVLRGAQEERDKWGEFKRRHQPPKVGTPEWPLPKPSTAPPTCCYELNIFNELPAPSPDECLDPEKPPETCEVEWPKIWPCSKRDAVKERNVILKKLKLEKAGALPCEIDEVDLQGIFQVIIHYRNTYFLRWP